MGKWLTARGKTQEEAKEKLAEEQRKAEETNLHPQRDPVISPDWHAKEWVAGDYASD